MLLTTVPLTILSAESSKYYEFWEEHTYLFSWFFIVSGVVAIYVQIYFKTIEEPGTDHCVVLLLLYNGALVLMLNGGGGEFRSTTAVVVPIFMVCSTLMLLCTAVLKVSYRSAVSYLLLAVAIGLSVWFSLVGA